MKETLPSKLSVPAKLSSPAETAKFPQDKDKIVQRKPMPSRLAVSSPKPKSPRGFSRHLSSWLWRTSLPLTAWPIYTPKYSLPCCPAPGLVLLNLHGAHHVPIHLGNPCSQNCSLLRKVNNPISLKLAGFKVQGKKIFKSGGILLFN